MESKLPGPSNKAFLSVMFCTFVCVLTILVVMNAGRFAESTDGRVVDESGAPVQGAIVIALWKAHIGAFHSSEGCYHVQSTKTSADGRYRFPSWWNGLDFKYFPTSNRRVDYKIYMPGYVEVDKFSGKHGDLIIEKFVGTKDQYFDEILSTSANVGICGLADHTGQIYDFAATATLEVESIAETHDQLTVVDSLRNLRDTALAKQSDSTK